MNYHRKIRIHFVCQTIYLTLGEIFLLRRSVRRCSPKNRSTALSQWSGCVHKLSPVSSQRCSLNICAKLYCKQKSFIRFLSGCPHSHPHATSENIRLIHCHLGHYGNSINSPCQNDASFLMFVKLESTFVIRAFSVLIKPLYYITVIRPAVGFLGK